MEFYSKKSQTISNKRNYFKRESQKFSIIEKGMNYKNEYKFSNISLSNFLVYYSSNDLIEDVKNKFKIKKEFILYFFKQM